MSLQSILLVPSFPRMKSDNCEIVNTILKNISKQLLFCLYFCSIWAFFYEHLRFAGQPWKGEGVSLTPLCHFHPLCRHLDISWAIATESSPLHIASSRTEPGTFSFLNDSLLHGPKGLRSRLHDGVRLQGPSHRSSFLFLSRHLSF